jgi:integrase/recombinase XerD
MSALAAIDLRPGCEADRQWMAIARRAPELAATAGRYLAQITVSLAPRSVDAADNTLRLFVAFLAEEHPEVGAFAEIGRVHIEGFKTWLRRRSSPRGGPLSANTIRQRLGTLRSFFDRMIEWDWPDAPARTPIFATDLPIVDDPLPRFLDDATAARLMRAAAQAEPLDRLVIELLANTGMRVSELCGLEADGLATIGGASWLRVPVGKLHNDRYVPLLPRLVELLTQWLATHDDGGTGRLLTRDGEPLRRDAVARMLNRAARRAGIGHVHPHQLRHTLATQAINRGMRLEAIAALLGHRSLRMTMVYARIANRTVADEYHAISTKVEALYAASEVTETPAMRQLRGEYNRMLGNGWCTRPKEMGCSFESICEGCGFFATTIEFRPTLGRQRDHAADHHQPDRVAVFDRLLSTLADDQPAAATRAGGR